MIKEFLDNLLVKTMDLGATDLHLCVGSKPLLRINTTLVQLEDMEKITSNITRDIAIEVLDEIRFNHLSTHKAVDTSYSKDELGRFRMNFYSQRGTLAVAIRSLPHKIPNIDELGLPEIVKELSLKPKGMVLVTGMTGSGKSTTLASIVQYINQNKAVHINTIEDPIEYLHKHNKALVTQKEIGGDALDFKSALSASLREDPDVIMLGEMRDQETIANALTGAETGHLLLSTLHTNSAIKSVDRIIDNFTGDAQIQARSQLATVLEGIISQQLLPSKDNNGLVLASEVLIITPAVRNLIRERKTYQISSIIQNGLKEGMISMERCLAKLVKENKVSKEVAFTVASDKKLFENYLSL